MMGVEQRIKKLVPDGLKSRILLRKGVKSLQRIQTNQCDPTQLSPLSDVNLEDVLSSRKIGEMWDESKSKLAKFSIPDSTGGVNPGDRRAIYYLITSFCPSSVLEIGTHIGSSTLHIAEALSANQNRDGNPAAMVSVDIADVNDPDLKPWLQYGSKYSPLEMLTELGLEKIVEFVKVPSLQYFAECKRKFDFIFLDGDHLSSTVYQEIPPALELLNPGGVILLHDYFPELKPLWSSGPAIPGPFLATERFREEGANLAVLPLGELPWTTKLQSNTTSLALLLRNG